MKLSTVWALAGRLVPEEALEVRVVPERTLDHLDARTIRVAVPCAEPAVAQDSSAAIASLDERDRLIGAQQRRVTAPIELLEILSPLNPVGARLREQPRAAQEADVSATEPLDEPVVQ